MLIKLSLQFFILCPDIIHQVVQGGPSLLNPVFKPCHIRLKLGDVFQGWGELVLAVVGLGQDHVVAGLEIVTAIAKLGGILWADAVTVLLEEAIDVLDTLGYWLLMGSDVSVQDLTI